MIPTIAIHIDDPLVDESMTSKDRIGSYQLIKSLGQGGMADVYLAKCEGPGGCERHVAVKVLDRTRSQDAEACALFVDEARLVAMLSHRNVAQVLEVASEAGMHYLAMEFVHGVDLRGLLLECNRQCVMPSYEVALAIVAQAAAGLDHAHRRCDAKGRSLQLVHRDVSLSNIMVGHDGAVKVVDFGIARSTLSTVQTMPGIVRGKASYMSPEQCVGDKVDRRTDVFALGIVLYELTTGARCFDGATDFERMVAIVRGDYTLPSQLVADYPVALEEVVRKALAADLDERYQSCAELINALENVMRTHGWRGGGAAIARAMHSLFGVVAEPWVGTPAATPGLDDETALDAAPQTIEQPALGAPVPTSQTHTLRLARGSMADVPCSEVVPPQPWYADEEEAMTRGRRPLTRWSTPQMAA